MCAGETGHVCAGEEGATLRVWCGRGHTACMVRQGPRCMCGEDGATLWVW